LEKTHKGTNRENPEIRTDNPNKTIQLNGYEIHPNENPEYYTRGDITNKGRWTLRNAINKEQYKEWIKFSRKKIHNEDRYYVSRNGNIKIGLGDPMFSRKVNMLSDVEKEIAIGHWEKYKKNNAKIKKAAAKAFDYHGGVGSKRNLSGKQQAPIETIKIGLDKYSSKIIDLFGRLFTPDEIKTIAIRDWKIPCTMKSLVWFRNEHIQEITERVEAFRKDFSDIRLTEKRGRIEEYVDMYKRAKRTYDENGSRVWGEFAAKLLAHIEKEVEGDVLRIDANIKIEHAVTKQVQQEILKKSNLSQIILSRVASRMQINPIQMIADMNSNIYAQFNPMINSHTDEELTDLYADLEYPSITPYDFHLVEKNQATISEERKNNIEEANSKRNKAREAEKLHGTRAQLLSALNKMEKDNNERGASIDLLVQQKQVNEAAEAERKKESNKQKGNRTTSTRWDKGTRAEKQRLGKKIKKSKKKKK